MVSLIALNAVVTNKTLISLYALASSIAKVSLVALIALHTSVADITFESLVALRSLKANSGDTLQSLRTESLESLWTITLWSDNTLIALITLQSTWCAVSDGSATCQRIANITRLDGFEGQSGRVYNRRYFEQAGIRTVIRSDILANGIWLGADDCCIC